MYLKLGFYFVFADFFVWFNNTIIHRVAFLVSKASIYFKNSNKILTSLIDQSKYRFNLMALIVSNDYKPNKSSIKFAAIKAKQL